MRLPHRRANCRSKCARLLTEFTGKSLRTVICDVVGKVVIATLDLGSVEITALPMIPTRLAGHFVASSEVFADENGYP